MGEPDPGETIRDENEFVELERDASGLVSVIAKIIDHDLEQARICGAFIHAARVDSGRSARVLVDMRKARSLSREARVYYQSEERAGDVCATALLVDSGVSRVLGNFVMGLNRSPMDIRLFTDVQQARAWLATYTEG